MHSLYVMLLNMLNLWVTKRVKRIEGEGLSNPKLKETIIERLLDRIKTLEMNENNRVVIAINQTIDALARLVEH